MEEETPMDTAVWIWIIVGVLVVAIIVVVALAVSSRGRAEKKRRAEHDRAEKLRAEARETELAARESEARAAQTKADAASAAAAAQQAQAQAAQAELDAQRLADTVGEHENEAMERRAAQQETLRKADEVDPYVTADATRDDRATVTDRDGDGVRDDRDGRVASRDDVPAAPDGVVGRDATAARHGDPVMQDTAHRDEATRDDAAHHDAGTHADPAIDADPAITRPPAWASDASVDGGAADGTTPPATRRDRA
jgi:uncharacterized membrane protein YccC